MQGPSFAGFGGGRKLPLTVLMWVTLLVTTLNWIIVLIFYWVDQSQRKVPIAFYLTPYWWVHILATGVFFAATTDSIQAVSFIFKPSVHATLWMGIATITDIVGGYFIIFDFWGQCIFNKDGLNSVQKMACNDETMFLWIVWVGSLVAMVFAAVGFALALWDSAVKMVRSRQFSAVSGGFQTLGFQGQRLAQGLIKGAGGGGGGETTEEPFSEGATEESLYARGGRIYAHPSARPQRSFHHSASAPRHASSSGRPAHHYNTHHRPLNPMQAM